MNILITGGAGFIGSHLTKRFLLEGHKVVVIDNYLTSSKDNLKSELENPNLHLIEQDVTTIDVESFTPFSTDCELIYHLASPASPNYHSNISYRALPMETMMVNTAGTITMLKLAEKQKAKFLFASTSEVYGDPTISPQPETYLGNVSTIGPRSVYDEAKRFGETLTAYYWRDRDVDARIVRIFNTYGPYMSLFDMRMTANFIQQALTGNPITVYGDGKQTRSLCYVDDTVEGLKRLMTFPDTKGEIVNIGSQEEHSVMEYAQIIKKLTGSNSEIVCSEKLPENEPLQRRADITKAKKLLDWESKTSLEMGLTRMIEYIRSVIIP
jgi:nucleoside-diphosphate-sugar epimerase